MSNRASAHAASTETPADSDQNTDHAFERRFLNVRNPLASTLFVSLGAVVRHARTWFIWAAIAIPCVLVAMFFFGSGPKASVEAVPGVIGNDTAWRGTIRHVRPPATGAAAEPGPVVPAAATLRAEPGGSSADAIRPSEADRQSETIVQIQQLLLSRGYSPGPLDGVPGARTQIAIMIWQLDNGLAVTGEPTDDVLQMLDRRKSLPARKDRRIAMPALTSQERSILREWCGGDRYQTGQPAYYGCLGNQLEQLTHGLRMPRHDGTGSTRSMASAHADCVGQLETGPQTYFACVRDQLARPEQAG